MRDVGSHHTGRHVVRCSARADLLAGRAGMPDNGGDNEAGFRGPRRLARKFTRTPPQNGGGTPDVA